MSSKVMKLDLGAIEAARNGCRESLAIVIVPFGLSGLAFYDAGPSL
jgi:hypothetical protein